jgi:hypothetical protein
MGGTTVAQRRNSPRRIAKDAPRRIRLDSPRNTQGPKNSQHFTTEDTEGTEEKRRKDRIRTEKLNLYIVLYFSIYISRLSSVSSVVNPFLAL